MIDIKPIINQANIKQKVKFTTKTNLKTSNTKRNIKLKNNLKIYPIRAIKKIEEDVKSAFTYKNYSDVENKRNILKYGTELYEYSRSSEHNNEISKDESNCSFNLLKNHEISTHVRTKLIDWLFEVFHAYKNEDSCIFLTIHLIDSYLFKTTEKQTNSEIQLIGVTSLLIASKFEDLSPLNVNIIRKSIAHSKYSEKEIKRMERLILECINFDLFISSSYDFIKNFIYDFSYNNRKLISKYKMNTQIIALENTSIYVSKIILHSDCFSKYKNSLKAIACIIAGFDLIRGNVIYGLTEDSISFFAEWIHFLIDQSRYESKLINTVYNEITVFFKEYEKIPHLSYNLKKNFNI